MTLRQYDPDDIDQLSLRIFDLAATTRRMSSKCREHELESFEMHDKKAFEWLVKLEQWLARTEGRS